MTLRSALDGNEWPDITTVQSGVFVAIFKSVPGNNKLECVSVVSCEEAGPHWRAWLEERKKEWLRP